MMDPLLSEKAEAIRQIARTHGVTRLRMFGSRAQGTGTEDSDLDLLADFEPGRDLLDVVALKQDLEALLGCKVDVVEEGALSPYLKDGILRQAVSL
ncbi:MAG TPA: nucleotidyltransferase family protein [Candidatus Deferrimicrobiaceae bacterium]|nr:nucleotidyltransferase family protein [Candidatus Deferrimicrobiaceae bacterium]